MQQWGSWFGDWGKGLLLGFLFASILGWILYAVLRRSPRRWWFYFWLAMIPILVFVLFITPVWIEPLFNKFEPLTDHHADLVTQIERVVHRGGMDIPPERMFEMKASEKTTELNAYVTGFGQTKRVVVWDTTMEHMTTPQTLFVFGHEMGHYVLGHIPKELAIFLLPVAGADVHRLPADKLAGVALRGALGDSRSQRLGLAAAAVPGFLRASRFWLRRRSMPCRVTMSIKPTSMAWRSFTVWCPTRILPRRSHSRFWASARSIIPTSASWPSSGRGAIPPFATA